MVLSFSAHAKINLTLDILGKRDDGYHDIETVMQTIALADILRVKTADKGIHLAVEDSDLPADESNIVWQAAEAFMKEYKINSGVDITLKKRIPVSAGLAGGSSDAAAILFIMNYMFDVNLPLTELCDFGAELGSDVPFCIREGMMYATGRGEKLKRLPDLRRFTVVLAKPPVSVSTAWAYKEYDAAKVSEHPDTKGLIKKVIDGSKIAHGNIQENLKDICQSMGNVLESVTMAKYPEVRECKKIMEEHGALGALMTGSGSTVFAFAKNQFGGQKIANAIKKYTNAWVCITETHTSKRGTFYGEETYTD